MMIALCVKGARSYIRTGKHTCKCTCAVTIDDTPKEEEEEEEEQTLLNKFMRISLCVSDDAIAKLYVM